MIWLDGQTIYGVTVEKHELPRPNGKLYRVMPTIGGIFVVHTTQGANITGAMSTLALHGSSPHFLGGEGRLIQCRPIGVQGSSLRGAENQYPVIQIECVGFSKLKPYLLDEPTLGPLVSLLAWAKHNLAVPMVRPSMDWKDDCSDLHLPWAANNSRRQSGVWPSVKGIYGHLEVANQGPSWHWDPGALSYSELFARVNAL